MNPEILLIDAVLKRLQTSAQARVYEILLMDAILGLKKLGDASVDLVVTDPPYESLEKWRNMGTTTRLKKSKQSSNKWFATVPNSYFDDFFVEVYRVLKKNTHFYIMCDEDTSEALKPKLRAAGFNLRKSIVWWKVGKKQNVACPECGSVVSHTHTPGTPGMGYPYRSQWEFILIAEKGKRKPPENKSVRNVQPIPIEDDDFHNGMVAVPWIKRKGAYPTEKPVDLCEILIRQSSFEGDLVLDTFAGSGSCGEAAFNLEREFLGFDVEQDALDYFQKRKESWHRTDGGVVVPDEKTGILEFFQ